MFDKIDDLLNRHGCQGTFIILMPEYRPDVARGIANHLGFEFFDYRQEIMLEFAREAHRLTLDQLSKTLAEKSEQSALIAFNVEALLAAKPENERKHWLLNCLQIAKENPVVIPLAIYIDELPIGDSRILDLRHSKLDEQTLVSRLIN
ncbi:MAG: hypothetical protein KZQ94_06070 [Candidatus Thiodiazotropha sp. (ex Troendleina suluensis)]|nr:hypothetical protein [Candidatus Thiodiazotropha sp. (ex Troendleina suluensis)]